MSARKSVLVVLGVILVSSLAVYALAALQTNYMSLPNLPNPTGTGGPFLGRLPILSYTHLPPPPPPHQGPPGVPVAPHPAFVVIRRADLYTPTIDKAFRQGTAFSAANFATYNCPPPNHVETLCSVTSLTTAKITDHHPFTDAAKYGANVLMESITFSYAKGITTTVPPPPGGGGTSGAH